MNKRIKKKRKDARKLEEQKAVSEKAYNRLEWFYRLATRELATCKRELQSIRNQPILCSHSVEPNYHSPIGLETHHLQVNAPLRINHTGPLHKNDVLRLAGELAEALHAEAIAQLMPHISTGIFR